MKTGQIQSEQVIKSEHMNQTMPLRKEDLSMINKYEKHSAKEFVRDQPP